MIVILYMHSLVLV